MPEAIQVSVSRYPVASLDALPEDIRARILKVQEKAGFIPNVFLMLAYRPDEFRAFMAYHDTLMDKPGGLSKAEREMIVVAVSSHNQCQYCVVALAQEFGLPVHAVGVGETAADLRPFEARDFARSLVGLED